MNPVKAIKKYIESKKESYRQEQLKKYYEVRGAIIRFFEDYDQSSGEVNIPAFKRADAQMKIITSNKELDFFYKKLIRYRLANVA